MDQSPYEILGNNVLSFDDIIKIKQVEDVLEKYWNDHRMDHTMEYLVTKSFSSPFEFFQQFGSYWEERGWSRIGHQLEDLFIRLLEFIQFIQLKDQDIILSLMKIDYLENAKFKPRKPWWEDRLDKDERSSLYQSFLDDPYILGEEFAKLEIKEKELYKHSLVEELSFDYQNYIQTGIFSRGKTSLLAYFEPIKQQSLLFGTKK